MIKEGFVSQKHVPKDDCAICLKSLNNPKKAVYRTQCGHFFHNNCLDQLCESSYPELKCPICRRILDEEECSTFAAFKEKMFDESIQSLPKSVQKIYKEAVVAGVN
jgi:hypothetical protein